MPELDDQGKLNRGSILVEGAERAVPHQTVYYTNTASGESLVRDRPWGYVDDGVRPVDF